MQSRLVTSRSGRGLVSKGAKHVFLIRLSKPLHLPPLIPLDISLGAYMGTTYF